MSTLTERSRDVDTKCESQRQVNNDAKGHSSVVRVWGQKLRKNSFGVQI